MTIFFYISFRAIYTSPIKALSNQKFRDFHETFGNVGLLTGDIQLNPDASCLIMTTEILRSMLYRGAALVQDVEFVIFDEVHYVNDQDRGVVWEEVIIMLPPHVTVIMLSATTPNNMEFADWVGRTRKCELFVISTLKRPVPLEHFLFTNRLVAAAKGKGHCKELYKIVDAGRNFLDPNYRSAMQSLQSMKDQKNDSEKVSKSSDSTTSAFRNVNQEHNIWTDVVYMLQKKELLPAVAFIFSKRKCDENADALSNLDLNSSSERSAVHIFMANSLSKLQGNDAELPQIVWLQDLLSRGIGVHHSGLLPLMKEAVEILFSRGLVKILFATETFAMGVNMPARTVIFSSLRKHDGISFRYLHPGEYTQMAGRAGRRGLDSTGTVIVLCPEQVLIDATLRQVILGQPTRLVSQFRLTYQMILSLLRIQSLRVEEMLKRSFSENANQKALPEQQAQLEQEQSLLEGLESLDCSICAASLDEFYAASREIIVRSHRIFATLLTSRFVSKHLPVGAVVIANVSKTNCAVPAIVLRVSSESLLVAVPDSYLTDSSEELVYPPNTVAKAKKNRKAELLRTFTVGPGDLVRITELKISIPQSSLQPGSTQVSLKDTPAILADFASQVTSEVLASEAKFPQFSSSAGGFETDEQVITRKQLLAQLSFYPCHACPDLIRHYTQIHRKKTLTDRLTQLQFQISDSSLHLLPEYESRVQLLQNLEYIDAAHTVLIKGRVACEVNTVDPLILTELLFENAFGPCTAGEIAAILAGMVFQERSALNSTTTHDGHETVESLLQRLLLTSEQEGSEIAHDSIEGDAVKADYLINVTPNIYKTCKRIISLVRTLSAQQRDSGLGHLPCGTALSYLHVTFNPALIRTVYEWTRGTPFLTLTTKVTTIAEGSIVRCMTRLDETCREVAGAGKIVGDPTLVQKMEEAARLIRRDICFSSSLYL